MPVGSENSTTAVTRERSLRSHSCARCHAPQRWAWQRAQREGHIGVFGFSAVLRGSLLSRMNGTIPGHLIWSLNVEYLLSRMWPECVQNGGY